MARVVVVVVVVAVIVPALSNFYRMFQKLLKCVGNFSHEPQRQCNFDCSSCSKKRSEKFSLWIFLIGA